MIGNHSSPPPLRSYAHLRLSVCIFPQFYPIPHLFLAIIHLLGIKPAAGPVFGQSFVPRFSGPLLSILSFRNIFFTFPVVRFQISHVEDHVASSCGPSKRKLPTCVISYSILLLSALLGPGSLVITCISYHLFSALPFHFPDVQIPLLTPVFL